MYRYKFVVPRCGSQSDLDFSRSSATAAPMPAYKTGFEIIFSRLPSYGTSKMTTTDDSIFC